VSSTRPKTARRTATPAAKRPPITRSTTWKPSIQFFCSRTGFYVVSLRIFCQKYAL
jgi:hypothetical protein